MAKIKVIPSTKMNQDVESQIEEHKWRLLRTQALILFPILDQTPLKPQARMGPLPPILILNLTLAFPLQTLPPLQI